MKYIDADKLKEDIQANLAAISFNDDYQKGYEACGMSVLKSIESLQQEQPSLPSNLDEAEFEYVQSLDDIPANQEEEKMIYDAFKAGAEWMAGQYEKIDDKHKAEMSIEYSLHCKVENRTRHAVMNWQEFQELAQKFINIGKDEALKDLPRWRRYSDSNNRGYGIHAGLLLNGDWLIELKDLEKLPKEDEK